MDHFGHNFATDTVSESDVSPHVDAHCLAPECYDGIIVHENNIFPFGLILYKHMVEEPAFPKSMTSGEVAGAVV
jgi:hypothetical protein